MLVHLKLSQDPFVLVLEYFKLSQDLSFKCWGTSHCPKTSHSSVGTLRTVAGPFVLVLGHFELSQDLFVLVLGHFVLSQDLSLKCWDTSHCPKTSHLSVGTLRTAQDLPLKCWDTSHCPKTTCSSVGTLRTVPGPFVLVLGHFALSQDLFVQKLGQLELSQNIPLKCWDTSHCPKTSHSSVGTLRTVPRLPAQVLGHFVLSQDLSS